MTIIVCLDDKNGMMFNKRRQSRDKLVVLDILKLTQSGRLYISPYSAGLFEGFEDRVAADRDFLRLAGKDDFCFVEDNSLRDFYPETEELIVYRWNRVYPSDMKLEFPLDRMKLKEKLEFTGKSHEKITREVYIK